MLVTHLCCFLRSWFPYNFMGKDCSNTAAFSTPALHLSTRQESELPCHSRLETINAPLDMGLRYSFCVCAGVYPELGMRYVEMMDIKPDLGHEVRNRNMTESLGDIVLHHMIDPTQKTSSNLLYNNTAYNRHWLLTSVLVYPQGQLIQRNACRTPVLSCSTSTIFHS